MTPAECARRLTGELTRRQQVGQLLMVALTTHAGPTGLDRQIATEHLGGILYLGGWSGFGTVAATSRHLQAQATADATGGIGLLVAADQEGGQVQQLTGRGFSTIPSALQQGRRAPATLRRDARTWADQLAGAGVNVNLAPVAGTVPVALGTANRPIGHYDREYGHTPGPVASSVAAFASGMLAGGVEPTVKHFPGLGRVIGNTDTTSEVTDSTTRRDDPYLEPFRAGIEAGAGIVMVSSARYTRIDPDHLALFSRTVIEDMLRRDLDYRGVVITDDVGAAAALAGVPVGKRATRFIAAGGDIVLTVDPATTSPLRSAIMRRMSADRHFAAAVRASVERVLTLKVRMGLADCTS